MRAWARRRDATDPGTILLWGFIDRERNGIVHAYEFAARLDQAMPFGMRGMVANGLHVSTFAS
jgi:hypothetical protein